MQHSAALSLFIAKCVKEPLRDRFMHEAVKRPEKLHERICHHAQDLFLEKFRGGQVAFAADEPCLVLDPAKGFQEMAWQMIEAKTELYGGLLVIALLAPKFYVETEASPKIDIWAGNY